ncbi:hypothetical protein ACS0TW_12010, partial [Klebsiella michiganensis]
MSCASTCRSCRVSPNATLPPTRTPVCRTPLAN